MTVWRTQEIGPQLHEDLGSDTLTFADETEEDVLRADVVVAELQGLPQGRARAPSWPAG